MGISKGYDDVTLKKLQNVQINILKQFIEFCKENSLQYFLIYGSALGAVRHNGCIPWDDDIDVGMLREDYDKFFELFNLKGIEGLELKSANLDKEYATRVTHLQKKDTTFISEFSKDLKCHLGICIDIFPFDKVSDEIKIKNKQFRRTYIYGKLLFLRGTGDPNIPAKGVKKSILKILCKVIHLLLIAFRYDSQKIYSNFEKYCTLSNNQNTKFYVCYGDYLTDIGVMNVNDIFPLVEGRYDGLKIMLPNNTKKHLETYYGRDYMKLPPKSLQINHYPYRIDFDK